MLLYPDWSNASDYETTCEHFGTVAIYSQELADAIQNIELDKELSNYRLTADQQYLYKTMNTKLPLLPVVGKEENQLFERLVLAAPQGPINFDQMAIEWCEMLMQSTSFLSCLSTCAPITVSGSETREFVMLWTEQHQVRQGYVR